MLRTCMRWLTYDLVLTLSAIAAIISSVIVPPDAHYAGYIDADTLIVLFALMLVMAGLRQLQVFTRVGHALVRRVHTTRGIALTLVLLCFLSSMLVTNDVALITFVPFAMLVLTITAMNQSSCLIVTLMTIAANLGSMLTPVGNPQNLFLYGLSNSDIVTFLGITAPYVLVSGIALVAACVLTVRNTTIDAPMQSEPYHIDPRLYGYLILFALCLCCVAGWLPHWTLAIIAIITIALLDRRLFAHVDYTLLLTFVCFFIFVGNISRVDALHQWLTELVNGHELLTSVASSQIISNVPAAVLLSGYTPHVNALIVGTNIGGLGTLIASMASLISYKQMAANHPLRLKRYTATFTLWNLAFLIVLYPMATILLAR